MNELFNVIKKTRMLSWEMGKKMRLRMLCMLVSVHIK
jgi:hypothetical protein